jgi:tRNA threonylcarbamoyl adenosine modification protein YjeE
MAEWILSSLEDTKIVASQMAKCAKKGDIYLLFGDLGSGKTTFSQFFIQSFFESPNLNVTSPTFPIIQIYGPSQELWHVDLYRIEKPSEINQLGLEEAYGNAIMLIEWPERLGEYNLWGNIIHLRFSYEQGVRKLIYS